MTVQQDFRLALRAALEVAVQWRHTEPVVPAKPPADADELRRLFDIGLPDSGRDGTAVIQDLVNAAAPGLLANTHPNFYAWVQGSSHPVGVAADLLTSAWGQNAALYQTSPAAAMAEEVTAGWLLDLLNLPAESSMAFVTGATAANFVGLAVGRNEVLRQVDYNLEEEGLFGAPEISVLIGEQAHSTVLTDLRHLGFGTRQLVRVKSDRQGRMMPADLFEKLERIPGPKILVLQAGHINSGAFDPFDELIPIAKTAGAWVHVDGAFGLWANALPELAHLSRGVELADSWTVDGHKWLQVPYDCGFAIVRDEAAHQRCMGISASYLVNSPDDGRSPGDYGMELSRRARGFAVWATLQALGRAGVAEIVLRHCQCASQLASRLEAVAGLHVINDVVLNQVAIVAGSPEPDDKSTLAMLDELLAENHHYVRGAHWQGHEIMRISVISLYTQSEHIDQLADSICAAWNRVQGASAEN